MPYQFVKDEDFQAAGTAFAEAGFSGDELYTKLKDFADGLEAERKSKAANWGTLQALPVGVTDLAANALSAIPLMNSATITEPIIRAFTGANKSDLPFTLDGAMQMMQQKMLDPIASSIADIPSEQTRQNVQTAQNMGMGDIRTYLSGALGTLPLTIASLIAHARGGAPASYATMALSEAGSYRRDMQEQGYNQLSDPAAALHGLVSGAIEMPQQMFAFSPMLNALKGTQPLLKAIPSPLRFLGGTAMGGVEEGSQTAERNLIQYFQASLENKARVAQGLDPLPMPVSESVLTSGVTGAGVEGILGLLGLGVGHLAKGHMARVEAKQTEQRKGVLDTLPEAERAQVESMFKLVQQLEPKKLEGRIAQVQQVISGMGNDPGWEAQRQEAQAELNMLTAMDTAISPIKHPIKSVMATGRQVLSELVTGTFKPKEEEAEKLAVARLPSVAMGVAEVLKDIQKPTEQAEKERVVVNVAAKATEQAPLVQAEKKAGEERLAQVQETPFAQKIMAHLGKRKALDKLDKLKPEKLTALYNSLFPKPPPMPGQTATATVPLDPEAMKSEIRGLVVAHQAVQQTKKQIKAETAAKLKQLKAGPYLMRLYRAVTGVKEVKGKTFDQMRDEILARLGTYTEGAVEQTNPQGARAPAGGMTVGVFEEVPGSPGTYMVVKKKIPGGGFLPPNVTTFQPVALDRAAPEEVVRGHAVESELTRLYEGTKLKLPEQLARIREIRLRALTQVVGASVANKLIPPGNLLGEPKVPQIKMENALVRHQYNQYVENLTGEGEKFLRDDIGTDAVGSLQSESIYSYMPRRTPLEEGGSVAVVRLPTGELRNFGQVTPKATSGLASGSRDFLPFFEKLEKATGIRWTGFEQVVQHASRLMGDTYHKLILGRQAIYRLVPRAWTRGEGTRMLDNIVMWERLHNDPQEVTLMNETFKQAGVPATQAERIAQFKKIMGLNITDEQVEAKVRAMARAWDAHYRWFQDNGFVHIDKFRTYYLPLIRENKAELLNPDTLAKIIRGEQPLKIEGADRYLDPETNRAEIENILQMIDTFKYLEGRGFPMPAKNDQFMQFQREIDKENTEHMLTRSSDLSDLADLYTRTYLRKMYFQHLLPGLTKFLRQAFAHYDNAGVDSSMIRNKVADYMFDIGSVPEAQIAAMNRCNLLTEGTVAPKMLRAATRMWEKHPLLKRYVALPQRMTSGNVLGGMASATYVWCLNLIGNPLFGLKNIFTQGMYPLAVWGQERYFRSVWRLLHDQKFIKSLEKYNLRPANLPVEKFSPSGRSVFRKSMYILMLNHNWSDGIGVLIGASCSEDAWDEIIKWRKAKGELTEADRQTLYAKLFNGKAPDTSRVLAARGTKDSAVEKAIYEGPLPSKTLGDEIFERLMSGKASDEEDAHRMLLQFGVEFANWRYGPGGTSRSYKSPLGRVFWMFAKWSVSNGDFLNSTISRKNHMLRRTAAYIAWQWLVLSVLSLMGVKAGAWWLFGVLPTQLATTSPIVGSINKVVIPTMTALKGMGEAAVPFQTEYEEAQLFGEE